MNNNATENGFRQAAKDEYPDMDWSQQFLCYSLKIFYDLTDREIKDAVTGLGSNERGLDAYFFKEDCNGNENVYLVQSKSVSEHRKTTSYVGVSEGPSLIEVGKQITSDFDFDIKGRNSALLEAVDEIRGALANGAELNFALFHFGEISDQNMHHYKNNNIPVYDKKEIIQRYKDYKSEQVETENEEYKPTAEEIEKEKNKIKQKKWSAEEKFEVVFRHPQGRVGQHGHIVTQTKGVDQKDKDVIICVLSCDQLIDMREKFASSIFDRNVRDYLGQKNSSVNRDIAKTIANSPEKFLAYNNGVHITCEFIENNNKASGDTHKVTLINPKIINGAQTVGTLFYLRNKIDKENFKNAFVVCKIIETTKHDNTEFAGYMTTASNNQNKIYNWDFVVRRSEHPKIAHLFSLYGLLYSYRRGEKQNRSYLRRKNFEEVVTLEKLAEIHGSQISLLSKAQKHNIFKLTDKGEPSDIYTKIFSLADDADKKIKEILMSYLLYSICEETISKIKQINSKKNYFISSQTTEEKAIRAVLSKSLGIRASTSTSDDYKATAEKKILILSKIDPKTMSSIVRHMIRELGNDCDLNNKIQTCFVALSETHETRLNHIKSCLEEKLGDFIMHALKSYYDFAQSEDSSSKPRLNKQNVENLKNAIEEEIVEFSRILNS